MYIVCELSREFNNRITLKAESSCSSTATYSYKLHKNELMICCCCCCCYCCLVVRFRKEKKKSSFYLFSHNAIPVVNNVTNFALVTNSIYMRVKDRVDTESKFLLSLVTDTLLLLYLTAQLKTHAIQKHK